MAGENNKNAEKWTEQEAEKFMLQCLELSESDQYDFKGEVAKAAGSYHHVFHYLSGKFPQFKWIVSAIESNCETNCFYNGKKGNINSALAIMNLKSNHRWTDRLDNTSSDGSMSPPQTLQELYDEERQSSDTKS